ncbi:helix-turn-helix domain-containing protein [Pseudomonas sp. MMS21-TM103]|uniref:helix-turn-helix domain-containing protein n=1 Tax=Pseudomonas sp. MMS21 TM103 TaxID=2886506 RepID=UPI001EDEB37A|nr:helix-turn-helix domain-containing protein [Pseudomonas sp. MMS21 TM103]MCG4452792.1 helix-turn-helix domain-containing protein [Pseudomonas sp. MMS21 TM103]
MPPDALSTATLRIVDQHNACWGRGDVAGVEALYHPQMQFIEHFSGRCYEGEALRRHVRAIIARSALDTLEYLDRPRVDGDTAFLRYREVIRSADGSALLSFSACDAVRVADGLIVEINEYALVQQPAGASKPQNAARKIALGPRALGYLLNDLALYFERQQPYLDPGLSLPAVAEACGYTRNQISYALNQGLGLTFYQYVNRARIAHVLASDPAVGILERARAAGFRSTSTFYAAYRAVTGQAPGQRN